MIEEGQLVSVESLRSLLQDSLLPMDEIVYAFAYGSAVLSQQQQQQQQEAESKMIDFILVVRDSYRFHQENLAQNPEHYAWPFVMARDQARRIEWWQRHDVVKNRFFCNPGLYFNVTETFKYGVVQVEDLVRDLRDWRYLYLAGRMHKPILTLLDRQQTEDTTTTTMGIQYSQDHCNLPAAMSASLLLLSLPQNNGNNNNEHYNCLDDAILFTQIAALSFTGDPRMAAGAEDPAKVSKLVQSPGQLHRFRRLYANALDELETKGILSVSTTTTTTSQDHRTNENRKITWDTNNPLAHSVLWDKLPQRLQRLHQPADPLASARALQTTLPTIVAPAARYQSIKGLATAGFQKSWNYAMRKLSKGILKR